MDTLRRAGLIAIRSFHTLVWAVVEAATVYLLVSGFARRTDKRAAIAGAIVTAETTVFVANGFRCPLTPMAESLGAESGSVTDIYLPRWLAHNLPLIHTPLGVLIIYLHGRNLLETRRET